MSGSAGSGVASSSDHTPSRKSTDGDILIDIETPADRPRDAWTNPRIGGGMMVLTPAQPRSRERHRDRASHGGVGVIARPQHLARLPRAASLTASAIGTIAWASIQRTTSRNRTSCVLHGRNAATPAGSRMTATWRIALQGAGVLEAEYKVPYLAHAPLEPDAVTRGPVEDCRLDILNWDGHSAVRVGMAPDGLHLENTPRCTPRSPVASSRWRLEHDYGARRRSNWRSPPGRAIKMTWPTRRGHELRSRPARHGAHAWCGQGRQGRGL